MICPKCEQGSIKKILFKKNEELAFLCDSCGAVWYLNESLNTNATHTIQSLTKDEDLEYSFVDIEENGEDKKSVMFPIFK